MVDAHEERYRPCGVINIIRDWQLLRLGFARSDSEMYPGNEWARKHWTICTEVSARTRKDSTVWSCYKSPGPRLKPIAWSSHCNRLSQWECHPYCGRCGRQMYGRPSVWINPCNAGSIYIASGHWAVHLCSFPFRGKLSITTALKSCGSLSYTSTRNQFWTPDRYGNINAVWPILVSQLPILGDVLLPPHRDSFWTPPVHPLLRIVPLEAGALFLTLPSSITASSISTSQCLR